MKGGRLGDWDVYMNECIDSTMDHIHVCFAVLLASDDPRTSWSFQRYRLDQKLVKKLVHVHTNLVLRESLDDVLHHLLPWDIVFVMDESVDEHKVDRGDCPHLLVYVWIVITHHSTYLIY